MDGFQKGDRVLYGDQVCVIEGFREGRWFDGRSRTEAKVTAVDVVPGELRIEGHWVPTLVLEPAPPKPKSDPESVALAAGLLRKGAA